MQKRVAVLVMAAIFLIPMGFLSTIGEAEASPDTVIVGNIQESDGSPIVDVTVLLNWDITTELSGVWYESTSKTNNNGEFEIIIPEEFTKSEMENTTIILRYQTGGLTGYIAESGNIDITVKNITESGTDVGIKIEKWNNFPIKYISTPNIIVKVFVEYDNVGINDAKITVKNTETNMTIIGTTEENGRYEFKLEPGKYKFSIERGGFLDWETDEDIELKDNAIVPLNVQLTLAPEKTYWGYDLPHLFALMGGVTALLLIMFVLIYMAWTRTHPGNIRIIDDSPDEEEEEE